MLMPRPHLPPPRPKSRATPTQKRAAARCELSTVAGRPVLRQPLRVLGGACPDRTALAPDHSPERGR